MASHFGDKDQGMGGVSKRPAQTVEGTATEVAVEPAPEHEAAAPAASDAEDRTERTADRSDPKSAPPPPSRSKFKSFATHFAAALVGGAVGAALVFVAGGFGTGNENAPAADLAAVEQRLAKLEAAPLPEPDTQTLSALQERVAALDDAQKANSPKLSELADDVAELQASLKALAKTAEQGGSVAAAAAVGEQIAAAEQRLESKVAEALAKGDTANASAIEQLQTDVAELKAKLGALAEAELGTGDEAALQPELAALSERLAKIEAIIPELSGALDKETAAAKSATLAIAFANLRAAVSDGRPYAVELDTMAALAPALGDFGVLPGFAENGIPTELQLTRAFAGASEEALAAPAPKADGSLVDSLMASAQSLVKVRRIDGAAAGEGASATLARAKSLLDNGDLAGAIKEIETLDGKARETFATWLAQAHARLGADAVLTRLEGSLLIATSGQTETTQP